MEHFLSANPGLRSRITYRFNFDDYTPDDLARIFEIQALKAGFALETLASLSEIGRCFQQTFTESERHSSNGRLAEKVFEKVQLVQTNRVAGTARELSLEQLQTITLKDIKQGMDDVKAMGNL